MTLRRHLISQRNRCANEVELTKKKIALRGPCNSLDMALRNQQEKLDKWQSWVDVTSDWRPSE